MANNTITIPKKEYQGLKIRALAFDTYMKELVKEKILKDFEISIENTNQYRKNFIDDLVEAKRDILQGNIKEISSLKDV